MYDNCCPWVFAAAVQSVTSAFDNQSRRTSNIIRLHRKGNMWRVWYYGATNCMPYVRHTFTLKMASSMSAGTMDKSEHSTRFNLKVEVTEIILLYFLLFSVLECRWADTSFQTEKQYTCISFIVILISSLIWSLFAFFPDVEAFLHDYNPAGADISLLSVSYLTLNEMPGQTCSANCSECKGTEVYCLRWN
jgi:hypothetical protein